MQAVVAGTGYARSRRPDEESGSAGGSDEEEEDLWEPNEVRVIEMEGNRAENEYRREEYLQMTPHGGKSLAMSAGRRERGKNKRKEREEQRKRYVHLQTAKKCGVCM